MAASRSAEGQYLPIANSASCSLIRSGTNPISSENATKPASPLGPESRRAHCGSSGYAKIAPKTPGTVISRKNARLLGIGIGNNPTTPRGGACYPLPEPLGLVLLDSWFPFLLGRNCQAWLWTGGLGRRHTMGTRDSKGMTIIQEGRRAKTRVPLVFPLG